MLKDAIFQVLKSTVCAKCPGCDPKHKPRCEAMYQEEAEAIMKLIDTSIQPPKNSRRYKFYAWFCEHVNFCMGTTYDGVDKPSNPVYDWFYKYWLFPFEQTGCACCNTVRGLIYGFILGLLC